MLVLSIWVAQVYVVPGQVDPPQALQMLGSGDGHSEFGAPVTLRNEGNQNLTILTVAYDGKILNQGAIGGTMPMYSTSAHTNSSSLCFTPTTTLVFPKPKNWNMDTGGLCAPTIEPGGMATLYLGVYSPTVQQHTLVIHTQGEDFVFTINPPTA